MFTKTEIIFQGLRDTPWKIQNELERLLIYPFVRFQFARRGIQWGKKWKIYGMPIIQKYRGSCIHMGGSLQLRSTIKSNPLGVHNKVIITTWRRNAEIRIGNNFGMTGGAICSAERIWIGDGVTVGANSTICDTDFHPLEVELRKKSSSVGKCKDIEIGDDVFVGMNCIILKGVHIKTGAVIGAGSVVSHDVPERVVVAGNPARIIRTI